MNEREGAKGEYDEYSVVRCTEEKENILTSIAIPKEK